MNNLQEATERICELKGSLIALDALLPALVETLPPSTRAALLASFEAHAEAARTIMLPADISDVVLSAFERDVERHHAMLDRGAKPGRAPVLPESVDALLLATTRVTTFSGSRVLTSASGFYFRRADRLFLVSNRHVFVDEAAGHHPDRVEIGWHTDRRDLTQHAVVSLPLFRESLSQWRDAKDTGGAVDVAVIEVPPQCIPAGAVIQPFDPTHLEMGTETVAMGDTLIVLGFPLGFHDTVHHLAVARSASIASAFGIRFQQQGYFLTDARTHRGSSGAPVLRRRRRQVAADDSLPWQLLGVHSTRMDMSTRDRQQDESLGLNCAWYSDVLLALTT